MTRKARIGVIGAGWWAAVNHFPVLKANPDCEIVAVNRLGAAELAELQRKFDIPPASRTIARCWSRSRWTASSSHRLTCCTTSTRGGAGERLPSAGREAADDDRRRCPRPDGQSRRRGQTGDRALWLELQGLDRRGPGAGRRRTDRAHRACRAADGLCARGPLRRPADEGNRGAHVPSAALDLGRSEAGRRLWLGSARACPRVVVPHRRSRADARCSPSPASRRPASTITMLRSCSSPMARPLRSRAAATAPKHRGNQIDLRMFGSEGVLLLDIERERLEVRRRDGRDEVVAMPRAPAPMRATSR